MLHSQVSARLRGSFSANKEQLFPNKYINCSKCSSEDLRRSSAGEKARGREAECLCSDHASVRRASSICIFVPVGWRRGLMFSCSVVKGHTTKETRRQCPGVEQACCKLAAASIATKRSRSACSWPACNHPWALDSAHFGEQQGRPRFSGWLSELKVAV